MSPFIAIVIVAGLVPLYNIDKVCRADTESMCDLNAYESCIHDEEAAKEKVVRDWAHYSVASRQECVATGGDDVGDSYVELMTCFEMQDWKAHSNDVGGSAVGGSPAIGGSPPSPSQIGGYTASHPLGGIPPAHIP